MSILPLALTAGVVGAAIEYPLGSKYPLRDPVSLSTRMLVTGALVAGSILIAHQITKKTSQ